MHVNSLDQDCLTHIFKHLESAEILQAVQCCSAWRDIGGRESLWRDKARQRWPEFTLRLDGYPTFKALVADDNRASASCVVNLEGKSSTYKYNAPDYYFECRLVSLQWDRQEDVLRLFFDARGEDDLREPLMSSLALAANAPFGTPLSSEFVLLSLAPSACELLVDEPGHRKGWLTFPGVAYIEKEMQLPPLPDVAARVERLGWALFFVYGNSFPVQGRNERLVWGSQFLDYEPVRTLVAPANTALAARLAEAGAWQLRGQPAGALQAEGEAEDAMRWEDLPREVTSRPWGGLSLMARVQ